MPLFRYFIVVGAGLMAGLYVLADNVAPPPLPPYFGQAAELPKNFYESAGEPARQTARRSAPAETPAPAVAEASSAPADPSPPPAAKVATRSETRGAKKTPHQTRARQQMPERIRTARGIGDMMAPIRLE